MVVFFRVQLSLPHSRLARVSGQGAKEEGRGQRIQGTDQQRLQPMTQNSRTGTGASAPDPHPSRVQLRLFEL